MKTVNFRNPKYVGDPINTVRIFNEKEVDELIVLDIDATYNSVEPDYSMIENLAAECRMPFCYGGGVKSVEQAQRIIGLGVEKIAVSSGAVERPNLISEIAERVGTQSVAVVVDVKKDLRTRRYEVLTHNGRKPAGTSPIEFAQMMEKRGAGEIILNSIDNDGLMKGYDVPLIESVRASVGVPMTVLGGAGSLKDIGDLVQRFGIIGAAAGSLFVFKGAYKAVLINYPNRQEKEKWAALPTS